MHITAQSVRTWRFFLLALAPFLPTLAHAEMPNIEGHPRIVDGDTVVINNIRIRLLGIDAPETDQICLDAAGKLLTCGLEARDRLTQQFGQQMWKCRVTGKDQYKRSLGACEAGERDVQRWMVEQGLALSFVRYSHVYDDAEVEAKAAKRGLWAGAFIAPWDWRGRSKGTQILGAVSVPFTAQAAMLSPATADDPPSPNCTIKGNVNRADECIYHLPGGRFYLRVKMDGSKRKRWFCSIDEAKAAGCRPPG